MYIQVLHEYPNPNHVPASSPREYRTNGGIKSNGPDRRGGALGTSSNGLNSRVFGFWWVGWIHAVAEAEPLPVRALLYAGPAAYPQVESNRAGSLIRFP